LIALRGTIFIRNVSSNHLMDRVTYRQHKIYVNYSIQNDNDWYKKKLDLIMLN